MKKAIDNKTFQEKVTEVYQKVKPDVDPELIDLSNDKKRQKELVDNEIFSDGMAAIKEIAGQGGGGTSDYETLENKPKVNGIELIGDKSLEDLGVPKVWESGEGECSVQQVNSGARANGIYSVAEGELAEVIVVDNAIDRYNDGRGAHAEGGGTTAGGSYSHAEGNNTITNNAYEHAEGIFNVSHYNQPVYPSADNTIHSIGIGSNMQNRKNAVEVMQNGDFYLYGTGNYDGTNPQDAMTVQTLIDNIDGSIDNINDALEDKQDTLVAGENITIEDNVISATGGGGEDKTVIVNFTQGDGEYFISDKTAEEIYNYAEQGYYVFGKFSTGDDVGTNQGTIFYLTDYRYSASGSGVGYHITFMCASGDYYLKIKYQQSTQQWTLDYDLAVPCGESGQIGYVFTIDSNRGLASWKPASSNQLNFQANLGMDFVITNPTHTPSQVYDAIVAGTMINGKIKLIVPEDSNTYYFMITPVMAALQNGVKTVYLKGENTLGGFCFYIKSTDGITWAAEEAPAIPNYTEDDEGSSLKIIGGRPMWSE